MHKLFLAAETTLGFLTNDKTRLQHNGNEGVIYLQLYIIPDIISDNILAQ